MTKNKIWEKRGITHISCLIVLLCLFIATPAVSASEWSQFQVDKINTGTTGDSAPITNPDGSSSSWIDAADTSGWVGIDHCPVIGDGKVYVVTYKGNVKAYYLNGTSAWNSNIGGTGGAFELATPAYNDNEKELYVALCNGNRDTSTEIYAINTNNGNTAWSHTDLGNQQANTPVTFDADSNLLFFGTVNMSNDDPVNLSDDGTYYCYDTDGVQQWTRLSYTGGGYYWTGAAVIGDYLVYGDDASHLVSVNKTSGANVSSLNVSSTFNVDAKEIRSSIVYNSDTERIYFTSKGGYCYALGINANDGTFDTTDKWSYNIGYSTSTPVVYGGRVYVGHNGGFSSGTLFCLYETNGDLDWSNSDLGPIQSSPAISTWYGDPHIYVTTNDGSGGLYCVNKSGSEVWHNNSYGASSSEHYCLAGASISGGWIFYGNDGGYLHALATDTRYDFSTKAEGNAYGDVVTSLPEDATTPSTSGVFTQVEYTAVEADDASHADSISENNGEYATQRFRFKIQPDEMDWISKLNVTWIGAGKHDSGGNCVGSDLYIWNGTAYALLDSTNTNAETNLTGSVNQNIDSYIDGSGYVTVLVKQKSPQTTDRETYRSYIETDYIKVVAIH